MDLHRDLDAVYYSEWQINEAVRSVAEEIKWDYYYSNPLLVGILKGSVVFMGDLMRALDIECEIDFMTVHSYGNGTVSSGVVEITKDLETDIAGRDVILIEDILDSARTLDYIVKTLSKRNPASIKICVLLDKMVERTVNIKADYKCFDIANQFVVGYGLDYAQKYRNLPYIGILKEEVYKK